MKKFFRYSMSSLLGWMGYTFVFFGLILAIITLFRQEFRWENLVVPALGLALIYTCYSQGRDERFDVSVKGNKLDDQIYKWIVRNGLASMEDLKKLDPPSESILDRDDLKKIKKESD